MRKLAIVYKIADLFQCVSHMHGSQFKDVSSIGAVGQVVGRARTFSYYSHIPLYGCKMKSGIILENSYPWGPHQGRLQTHFPMAVVSCFANTKLVK